MEKLTIRDESDNPDYTESFATQQLIIALNLLLNSH